MKPQNNKSMHLLQMLYLGPDQIPPMASWLAGIVGVLMIFWQRLVATVRGLFNRKDKQ